MEFRVLKYFWVVSHEGSFTSAAEKLHMTQPALSRQIKQLEEELDTTLFIRGKELILTYAGMLLMQRAATILEYVEKTKEDVSSVTDELRGTVCVGCTETAATSFLTEKISQFAAIYPDVKFEVYSGYSDDICAKLDSDIIDIGILIEPAEIAKYDSLPLNCFDQWGVVVNKKDSISQKKSITPSDLKGRKVSIPCRKIIQSDLEKNLQMKKNGIIYFGTHNLFTHVIQLVDNNICCAVGTHPPKYCITPNIVFIPFEPKYERRHVLVWKRNKVFTNTVQRFMNFCAE